MSEAMYDHEPKGEPREPYANTDVPQLLADLSLKQLVKLSAPEGSPLAQAIDRVVKSIEEGENYAAFGNAP